MLYRRRRTPGLALKLFRGERDISGFDWPFTPIHGSSLRFQPKWVRPSTGSYPRLSLPMDSSPGFASAARDYVARLKTRLRCGSVPTLTSPRAATRWLILQKARRHTALGAPTACGRTVSGAVSLPPGVLFTFPSRYSFAIGHRRVFSLGGWSPCFGPGFTCPALLGKSLRGEGASRTGLSPAAAGPSMPFRCLPSFLTTPGERRPRIWLLRPPCGNAGTLTRAWVWARAVSLAATPAISVDFSSSGT